jgi:hypothetical protein
VAESPDAGGMAAGAGVPLDNAFLQSQASQVRAAPASALVPDAVQVSADCAHADEELPGYFGVSTALSDQGNQVAFPCAEQPS